ncbi:hypothetical protein [uncultured Clostridium sp.]|uniref:DUF1659 domain-containing protein n=1 Tax=uncultured Clostridium sp. TaxID=59620 RepID=UPI0025E63AB1|nr:hypothetical protein [uncultured Clostridium sp.]
MAVEEKFKSLQGKVSFQVYNDDSGEYDKVSMKAIDMKEGTSNDDILSVLRAVGDLSEDTAADFRRIDTTCIEGEPI